MTPSGKKLKFIFDFSNLRIICSQKFAIRTSLKEKLAHRPEITGNKVRKSQLCYKFVHLSCTDWQRCGFRFSSPFFWIEEKLSFCQKHTISGQEIGDWEIIAAWKCWKSWKIYEKSDNQIEILSFEIISYINMIPNLKIDKNT